MHRPLHRHGWRKEADPTCKADADEVLRRCENAAFAVSGIRHAERRKHPAPPFTTSNLQQEACAQAGLHHRRKPCRSLSSSTRAWSWQGEGSQGLVTYIRTDSTRIADEAVEAAREHRFCDLYGEDYVPEKPNVYKSRKSAQDAHEAIRPTDTSMLPPGCHQALPVPGSVPPVQADLSDRFVASQMTPAVYDTLSSGHRRPTAARALPLQCAEKLSFAGFTAVYEEGHGRSRRRRPTAKTLPDLSEGMPAETGLDA